MKQCARFVLKMKLKNFAQKHAEQAIVQPGQGDGIALMPVLKLKKVIKLQKERVHQIATDYATVNVRTAKGNVSINPSCV